LSYDYILFIAPAPGPMSDWPVVELPPLGSLDFVRQRVTHLFPDASWRQFAETWFGRATSDGMEFQVSAGEDGVCRHFTLRRVTRDEVVALCRELGLVAVDVQKIELIRP
jgi:hypothetical protein